MYAKLLPDILKSSDVADATSDDQLKMVVAIHKAITPQISYEGIAAALLTMLSHRDEDVVGGMSRLAQDQLVRKLRAIIRAIASELSPFFDGCALMGSLLSFDVRSENWSTRDEENKARLMFQCVTMHAASALGCISRRKKQVPQPTNGDVFIERKANLRKSLHAAKQALLTWCCADYGPRFNSRMLKVNDTSADGAGVPDFRSVLGQSTVEERIPTWLNSMRCILFLEDADSPLMKRFLHPDKSSSLSVEAEWTEELSRIRVCCEFSSGLDDGMVWAVVKSSSSKDYGIAADMAIQLLENLFESCANGRGILNVQNPFIVWELYNLVECTLPNIASELDDSMLTDLPRYGVASWTAVFLYRLTS
jgi:hypothetical protein